MKKRVNPAVFDFSDRETAVLGHRQTIVVLVVEYAANDSPGRLIGSSADYCTGSLQGYRFIEGSMRMHPAYPCKCRFPNLPHYSAA